MANFLSEDKKQLILSFLRLGYGQRDIQRRTGVRRETVKKYGIDEGILTPGISKPATKVATGSKPCRSLAEPYREKIEESLAIGLNAVRIYQDLKDIGFPGKYNSIKRFVGKLKKQKPEYFCRIETPPGREAQVDLGRGAPTRDPLSGKHKRPYVFIMKLSFSRKSYQEVIWKQDVESFIRAHENAFRFFGGVPEIIILDNLKAGVIKACFYDPTINPIYMAFAKHSGFEPLPCKVNRPEHKGKVESDVNYVQDNALKGRTFDSLAEQNNFLRHWNENIASVRIHGTTKEQVNKRFNESEKQSLKSLPEEPFKLFKIGKRRIHTDGHIEVDGAYYSVPCEHLGEEVTVHHDAVIIRVFNSNAKEIAVHLRQVKGRFRTLENHIPEHKRWSQLQLESQLKDQAAHIGKDASLWAEKIFAERGLLAIRVLQGLTSLSRRFPAEHINYACKEALKYHNFSYRTIKILCEQQKLKKERKDEVALKQEDEIIRPLAEYAF